MGFIDHCPLRAVTGRRLTFKVRRKSSAHVSWKYTGRREKLVGFSCPSSFPAQETAGPQLPTSGALAGKTGWGALTF